ncbi:M23 family metallopeptidase, partial [Hyphomonas adhaerens]
VGKMGTTGRSTGDHLHFEVWFNGKPYDPIKFLKAGRHVHQE